MYVESLKFFDKSMIHLFIDSEYVSDEPTEEHF